MGCLALGNQKKCGDHQCAQAEQEEKEHKDRRKRLREQRHTDGEAGLHCNHPGCSFASVNKAGLTLIC